MKRADYIQPAFDCHEIMLEEGIATSANVEIITPEEWEKGNVDWW